MPKPAPASESELVAMLRKRYEQDSGNGPQGAIIPQVRDAAGFDAKRTIDAIAVSFWPSRGLLLDGFECKSSRSDFQRELEAPAKAERFCELVDRFWLVAGRDDIVRDLAEVPEPWGVLVAKGGKLVQLRAAALLREGPSGRRAIRPLPPGFDRGFLIALIRQAHRLAGVKPQEVTDAALVSYQQGVEQGKREAGWELERLRDRQADVEAFERGMGVRIGPHRTWGPAAVDHSAEDVGRIVKAVLDGTSDVVGMRNRLAAAAREAAKLADEAQQRVTKLDVALTAMDEERAARAGQLTIDEPEATADAA